nr:hypothetical protein [Tanacetum cinerariifolium]
MEDKIRGLGNGRVIIQQDFDRVETKLEEASTQIVGLQKKQIGHDDEVVLARVRISTLEMIIEDIQVRHQSDIRSLLEAILNVDRMAPKRTSTSVVPAMTQAAIRKLVIDSVATALEAQAANMANANNINRNTEPIEALVRIEEMEDKIRGLGNGRVIIQQDFDRVETKLEEASTQIVGLQKKQIGHDDEVVLARVRISTLEMIIEDIQVRHQSDIRSLLEAICELKNNK